MVKVSDEEIKKIERLAEKIGREDRAVAPMEIRVEMLWTAREWGTRKHAILAAGINVVYASEIKRRDEDAREGRLNLRILEWVFFQGHRSEIVYGKRPTSILRSLGAGKTAAVGIIRMAKAGFDSDHPEMYEEEEKMTVRALKVKWEAWTAMKEFYRRQWEDRRKESEAAEKEKREKTDAEYEEELEALGNGET